VDGVGGEGPIVPGGLALPQGFHEPHLALLEAQLDARADESVGLAALPLDPWLAHEDAESAGFVEQQRIGARRKIAAVDRHLASRPHAIVTLEADPVAHDDVGLPRVGGLAVFDGGPRGGEHLDGVAYAPRRPVVVEMGAAQDGAVATVRRHHVLARLEALVAQEIRGEVRIEGERRIADDDVSDEVDAALAPVHRDAVRGEGTGGAFAVGQDATAGEPVGVARRGDDLAVVPADRVDHDRARPAGAAVGGSGGGGLLEQREQREAGHDH
jgi:hypothetical protein